MTDSSSKRPACQFCRKFSRDGRERHSLFDRILWEDDDFVIVPAVGSLVEGYVLLVPRQHRSSMAQLPMEILARVESTKILIRQKLTQVFRPPIFFEHGPVATTNRAGACVDHVHLHCVATDIELLQTLKFRQTNDIRLASLQRYRDIARQVSREQSYVYYETQRGEMFVLSAHGLPSQYLRRLLAKRLGYKGLEWDYAVFPFRDNAERTVAAFSDAPWLESTATPSGPTAPLSMPGGDPPTCDQS